MPDATAPRSAAIEQLLTVGRPERAEQLARDELASNPEQALVMCLLGRAQLAQDRPGDALESAQRAVTLAPHHPEPHRFLAVAAAANGERRTARSALNAAVALAPQSAAVHQTRAQVLLRIGNRWDALDAAHTAVRLAPDHAGVSLVLAACLTADHRWDEAATEADRALSIDPDDVAAQELRAQLAVVRGEADAADRSRRALGMRPTDADTRRLVVASLQSRYRVVRTLVRLDTWIADLPTAGRWLIRLAPFLILRVLAAVHSDAALVLAAPVLLYVLLTWTVGPITMLLLMRRAETRKFLSRLQRCVATSFGVLVLLMAAAGVAVAASGFGPLILAALAFGAWAFTIGGLSDVGSRRLRKVVLTIAGAAAVAAVVGTGFAIGLPDERLVTAGFGVALVLGIASCWVVAFGNTGGSDANSKGQRRGIAPPAGLRRH